MCEYKNSHVISQTRWSDFPNLVSEDVVLPKKVIYKAVKNESVIGIAAGRFHAVIYTKEAVFTFGLNGDSLVGQIDPPPSSR